VRCGGVCGLVVALVVFDDVVVVMVADCGAGRGVGCG